MKKTCLIVGIILLVAAVASAQSPASNKAFFASNLQNIRVAAVGPTDGWTTPPIEVFVIPQALKTSSVGAVSATLSMEAALWTYNLVEATLNGGRQTSSSRAAIKAWVEIDGVKMEPGKVVYADRLQATGLELANWSCAVEGGVGCTLEGDVILELFQRTKNANAFTFFLGPLDPKLHEVKVYAQGFIECRSNGEPIACPRDKNFDGYVAQTKAVIGKATLLLEEHNNWGFLQNPIVK